MRESFKVLVICLLIGLSCAESYSFQDSSCTFNYENVTQQGSFSFINCTYKQCRNQFRDGSCSRSEIETNSSYQNCTRVCCDASKTYDTTLAAIQQCQDDLKSSSGNVVVGVAVGCIVLLLLIFLISFCICKWHRCYKCRATCIGTFPCCATCINCNCLQTQKENDDLPAVSSTFVYIPDSQELVLADTETALQRPNWIEQKKNQNKDMTIPCVVCLKDLPSIQLHCGHLYHRRCILETLVSRTECMMCGSKKMKARIYCQECFQSYFQTNLVTGNAFQPNQQTICTACSSLRTTN